jgi:hypothetical protein
MVIGKCWLRLFISNREISEAHEKKLTLYQGVVYLRREIERILQSGRGKEKEKGDT